MTALRGCFSKYCSASAMILVHRHWFSRINL